MHVEFLGRVEFTRALREQEKALARITSGRSDHFIFGFEAEPVITLGLRAEVDADLLFSHAELQRRGFSVAHVDRGGQVTLHNPGQLVIFPIYPMREIGARAWVKGLAHVTQECLREWNIESHWQERQPGLYTERGKIMACGVRIRNGLSTHGVAINVSNLLTDFSLIRACGLRDAALDRMGEGVETRQVFVSWVEKFKIRFPTQLTR